MPTSNKTPTETSTLASFLLARIAEDEAVARAALFDHETEQWRKLDVPPFGEYSKVQIVDDGVWSAGEHAMDEERVEGKGIEIYPEGGHNAEQAQHIARHDPARVLAECEAKRRIVDRYANAAGIRVPDDYDGDLDAYATGLLYAVKNLALPFADHPDYREEWKP